MIKRIILEILRITISIIWSVVGAIFWIPFLARMIAVFTVSVLLSVTKGTPMGAAEKGLNAGVTFYIEGFRKISSSINNIINGTQSTEVHNNLDLESYKSIFIQLGYTMLFWISTLFLIGYIAMPENSTLNTSHASFIEQQNENGRTTSK